MRLAERQAVRGRENVRAHDHVVKDRGVERAVDAIGNVVEELALLRSTVAAAEV